MPVLKPSLAVFQSLYALQEIITCPDEKMRIKHVKERQCRFCGRRAPEAKFKKDAHTIPQCLGNRYHITAHECDECNEGFSAYENDLKTFYGIVTALSQTGSEGKIKSFMALGKDLTAKESSKRFTKGGIEIAINEGGKAHLNFDPETGEQTFSYIKGTYKPLRVYKALLKIAITSLSNQDAEDYSWLLAAFDNDELLAHFAHVQKMTLAYDFRKIAPSLLIFKKKDVLTNCHTHICAFYYQNVVLQFPLPMHKADLCLKKSCIFVPTCPPLFSNDVNDDRHFRFEYIDLSSNEPNRQDGETWHGTLNKAQIQNAAGFDADTGKRLDPSKRIGAKTVGFILRPAGSTLPIDNDGNLMLPE